MLEHSLVSLSVYIPHEVFQLLITLLNFVGEVHHGRKKQGRIFMHVHVIMVRVVYYINGSS